MQYSMELSESADQFLIVGPVEAGCRIYPAWLGQHKAETYFSVLTQELVLNQETLSMFGRLQKTPRLVAWYGDTDAVYRYSGTSHFPMPWHPLLSEIKQRLEVTVRSKFNSVLANYYRDGRDSMGWHSDSEPELGMRPLIASISLGEDRVMRFRHTKQSQSKFDLKLTSGSLLVMSGQCQEEWQHSVPKTSTCKRSRLNLTYRFIHSSIDT